MMTTQFSMMMLLVTCCLFLSNNHVSAFQQVNLPFVTKASTSRRHTNHPIQKHQWHQETATTNTRLQMNSLRSSSTNYKVIYQKVLRIPNNTNNDSNQPHPSLFLPSLVNYIQSYYQIPNDLLINYDFHTIDSPPNDDSSGGNREYSIAYMDSPLSRNPDDTRMDIEVIGIYPEQENDDPLTTQKEMVFPTMAMVIIKKLKIANKDANDVSMRLFEDSEHKIIKSFDLGLDDFLDGTVEMPDPQEEDQMLKDVQQMMGNANIQKAEDVDWDLNDYEGFDEDDSLEKVVQGSQSKKKMNTPTIERDGMGNVVIETTATSSTEDVKTESKSKEEKKKKSTTAKSSSANEESSSSSNQDTVDFAVQAAKAAAAKRKERSSLENEQEEEEQSKSDDFAIEAAKRAAKAMSQNARTSSKDDWEDDGLDTEEEGMEEDTAPSFTEEQLQIINSAEKDMALASGEEEGEEKFAKINGVPLGMRKKRGSFQMSISKPSQREKRRTSEKLQSDSKGKIRKERNINIVKDDTLGANAKTEEERQSLFGNLAESRLSPPPPPPPPPRDDDPGSKPTKSDAEIEDDIMKAAMELMPGKKSDDDNDDELFDGMTAEEMLKDVLKFGEEKEKEEAAGNGFTTGAFAKANELIQEERAKKPVNKDVQYKEINQDVPEFMQNVEPETDGSTDKKKLSVEEELKQIFAAGENIAEGRMVNSPTPTAKTTPSGKDGYITDEKIQELIDSDETVPQNARSLDQELAELEVRIGKSPGESEDEVDNGPNAIFDIFSGPEKYNPNVDPETSVNWPGAQPGTRTDINLPPELKTAVKNAEFAADLLSKMIINYDNVDSEETISYSLNGKKINEKQVNDLKKCVEEGVAIGLIPDPIQYLEEKSRLAMLLNEMTSQPEERYQEILQSYKDLALSDNIVLLVKDRLRTLMTRSLAHQAHPPDTDQKQDEFVIERNALQQIVSYAQFLLKEAQAYGTELEATQLEVIRSICSVAMDPSHETEQQTAEALTDAVRDMRPLLDENFIAYLKYAIAEEEAKLARQGVLDDPEYNRWLFVLKIIQEGVYAELEVGVKRYIDHIWYVLRMETKTERRALLSELIDVMPSMDVRPFVKVVDNISASLGAGVNGNFEDTEILGDMTNKILQLRRDVEDLLPPERLNSMSKEADEWAARQKKRLMESRNLTKQRLKAARETDSIDVDAPGRGEIERMT